MIHFITVLYWFRLGKLVPTLPVPQHRLRLRNNKATDPDSHGRTRNYKSTENRSGSTVLQDPNLIIINYESFSGLVRISNFQCSRLSIDCSQNQVLSRSIPEKEGVYWRRGVGGGFHEFVFSSSRLSVADPDPDFLLITFWTYIDIIF